MPMSPYPYDLVPDSIWNERWLSLSRSICASQQLAENAKFPQIARFLGQLREFAEAQFYYFYYGFSRKDDVEVGDCLDKYSKFLDQNLVVDYKTPPDYVLRVLIDQIIHDYEVVHRALVQRLDTSSILATSGSVDSVERSARKVKEADQNDSEDSFLDQKANLKFADRFATYILEQVDQTLKRNGTPNVISYFNRSAQIRLIPYDNTALIGVPVTAAMTNDYRDLLAIPHEIGHYVYWHGEFNNYRIRDVLNYIVEGEMPFLKNWIEEIFSDVFGIFVLGTLRGNILDWIFKLVKDNKPDFSHMYNNVYPFNTIRPYISLIAINKYLDFFELSNDKNAAHNNLLTYYASEIKEFNRLAGGMEKFKVMNRLGESEYILIKDLLCLLDNIIGLIVDNVVEPILILKLQQNNPNIYNTIASPRDLGNFIPESDETYGQERPKPKTLAFEIIRENTDLWNSTKMPIEPSIWKVVFEAGGWVVKGPEASIGGKT